MPARQLSPEEQAGAAYNAGLKLVAQAKEQDLDASKAPNPDKKLKLEAKAAKTYAKALDRFTEAVKILPGLYEAWNLVGFTQRHLGHYQDSLDAYNHALQLKPDYVEAIEYRGEAYLGLNRLDDAKGAYMTLFRSARNLADQLLVAMNTWLGNRRAAGATDNAAELDSFGQWVQERGTIAAQTASLGITVPTRDWR
jgi:tetratricopeptide (TPR) repeat protein